MNHWTLRQSHLYKYLHDDDLLFSFHLLGIDLQSPVHAGASQVGGVLPEPHSRGDGGMLGDDLEGVPLLAEVDPHVGPGHC